jgi:hypothetical protein
MTHSHDEERDARLSRLLQRTGAESVPSLEPDPHLPLRIRAMSREFGDGGMRAPAPRRRRWLPVSLAAAAVAMAFVIGGYVGYSAGTSVASARASDAVTETVPTETVATLWSAWSQAGFADDLQTWTVSDNEVQP